MGKTFPWSARIRPKPGNSQPCYFSNVALLSFLAAPGTPPNPLPTTTTILPRCRNLCQPLQRERRYWSDHINLLHSTTTTVIRLPLYLAGSYSPRIHCLLHCFIIATLFYKITCNMCFIAIVGGRNSKLPLK